MNPLVYAEFWMVEATNSTHTWTVDNIEDLPFVSLETAQANCDRYCKEFPGTRYKPIQYMKVVEKDKVQ